MGLHEWQRALSAMIIAPRGAAPELADAGLTADERRWLLATAEDPGLRVTRHAQRSWRRMRLATALPLTMAALAAAVRDAVIETYLDTIPCVSFFHAHEARGFARFLAQGGGTIDPHVLALATFEVAVADAMEHRLFAGEQAEPLSVRGDSRLRLHPAASVVTFAAAPERVLGAAMAGAELPPPEDAPHALLVAPGLGNLARAIDAEEQARLRACTAGVPVGELVARQPEHEAWIARMLAQQALAPCDGAITPAPARR